MEAGAGMVLGRHRGRAVIVRGLACLGASQLIRGVRPTQSEVKERTGPMAFLNGRRRRAVVRQGCQSSQVRLAGLSVGGLARGVSRLGKGRAALTALLDVDISASRPLHAPAQRAGEGSREQGARGCSGEPATR